jgi:hypothetical protein
MKRLAPWRPAFDEQGFAIVRGLFDPDEMAEISEAFDRLLALARTAPEHPSARFVVDRDPFRLHRVVWCGGAEPVLAKLGDDERFLRLAAGALDSSELVQLIQQAHFKLPGDGVGFGWHQDASNRRYGSPEWTDVDGRGSFVQLALAVDAMTPDAGPLRMVPGSHRLGFLADPGTGALPEADLPLDQAVDVLLDPGDVAIFGPFVVHGSAANTGPRPRRLFLQGYALPGANHRVYPGCGLGVQRSAAHV